MRKGEALSQVPWRSPSPSLTRSPAAPGRKSREMVFPFRPGITRKYFVTTLPAHGESMTSLRGLVVCLYIPLFLAIIS